MLQCRQMKHLYLFTLEIGPLDLNRAYDELPSHLTLMSRFMSDLPPEDLAATVRPLFVGTAPIRLVFGEAVELGSKKVMAYMVDSPDEPRLHKELRKVLDRIDVEYQYPEFIDVNHKPHVTKREGVEYKLNDQYFTSAAYLIEVVDKRRLVHAKFELKAA